MSIRMPTYDPTAPPYPGPRVRTKLKPPKAPYYMPPYYPIPMVTRKPTTYEVDRSLPSVRFMQRPRALKIAIVLLIIGVTLCSMVMVFLAPRWTFYLIVTIIAFYFISIIILGTISIILLMIPKKAGWYFAFITGVLALGGFGLGTLIGIFTLFALIWPSVRYYFHTGQYPPMAIQSEFASRSPYPTSYEPPRLHSDRPGTGGFERERP